MLLILFSIIGLVCYCTVGLVFCYVLKEEKPTLESCAYVLLWPLFLVIVLVVLLACALLDIIHHMWRKLLCK